MWSIERYIIFTFHWPWVTYETEPINDPAGYGSMETLALCTLPTAYGAIAMQIKILQVIEFKFTYYGPAWADVA